MSTALSKIGAEAVATNVFHLVLVGKGRYCAGGVFPVERFVEKDKIREAAANGEVGFLERFEVSL